MTEKINVQIKLSFGNTDYSFSLKKNEHTNSLPPPPGHLEMQFPNKHHNNKKRSHTMHMISETTQQSELVTALISLNKDKETVGKEPLDK